MHPTHKLFAAAAVVAGLATAAAPAAQAHAIWFAQRAKHNALIYGVGGDDLDMVKRLSLVLTVKGYDADQKPIPTTIRADGAIAVIDTEGAPSLLTATMFNKIWSRPKDGGEWVEGGRDVYPDAKLSEKNYKFTVYVASPLKHAIPVLPDQLLQIVPVGPIPQTIGAPLKMRVLLRGKPLANAPVVRDFVNDPDATPLRTAKDGTVTIRVRNQGLNVVNTVATVPPDDAKVVDQMEYEATLAFVLPHKPE